MTTAVAKMVPTVGRQRNRVDTSTYSGRLAVRIRELREAAELDVKTVAKRMAKAGYTVAASTVYSWENGTNDTPADAFPFLARAVKVTVHELLPEA